MFTFLLADDHSIVRLGVKALIREHFLTDYIHEASNGRELEEMVKQYKYNMILLDINIPDTAFTNTLPWLIHTCADTGVLIFSDLPEDVYGIRSIKMGASGFLHKCCTNREIVEAIQRILSGRKYIPANIAELIVNEKARVAHPSPFNTLSDRELEIAVLLERGLSLPTICRQLSIQYSTCNTYKRRIFEKLNINNVVTLSRLIQVYGLSR